LVAEVAEAARLFALISPVRLIVRALKSESATRLAVKLAASRRHGAVAIMDGMLIGRALRFLRIIRIMVNPFSVQIHCDETNATRGRHA
jgi:hypothetical protein